MMLKGKLYLTISTCMTTSLCQVTSDIRSQLNVPKCCTLYLIVLFDLYSYDTSPEINQGSESSPLSSTRIIFFYSYNKYYVL